MLSYRNKNMPLTNYTQTRFSEFNDQLISLVDWRFLLPNPNPEKTLCLSEGRLADTVHLFSANTLFNDSNTYYNEVDLVIVSDPDARDLERAISALKPGAPCYSEWPAGVFFNAESVRKKLKDAGFGHVDMYIPKPSPDIAQSNIWISLDSCGSINYIVSEYYQSTTKSIFQRIGNAFRIALLFLTPRMFIKYPWLISSGRTKFKICSIALKTNTENEEPDIRSIKYRNLEKKGMVPIYNSQLISENINLILKSGGQNRRNKIVLVVFDGDSIVPSYIVKIPRVKEVGLALMNEANILKVLAKDYNFITGIPQVLFSSDKSGYFSVGETYIPGTSLGNVINKDNIANFAGKLTTWLVELAKKSTLQRSQKRNDAYIKSAFEDIEYILTQTNDRELYNKLNEFFSKLEISNMICEHRDLAPWNIIVGSNESFYIHDWESSKLEGIPGLDLIYFMTYLCFYVEHSWTTDEALKCYKRMFERESYTGELFEECFTVYATELDLPKESIRNLCILTWVTHLASALKQLSNGIEIHSDVGHDTKSLFLCLLRYELS